MTGPHAAFPAAAPVALFQADREGGIVYANPACVELLGRRMETLAGSGWLLCVRPQEAPAVQEAWAQAVASQSSFRQEFCVVKENDRLVWVRVHATPMFDGDCFAGMAGCISDVSEQRRLALFLHEAELGHEQAADELERFAFSASHDLQESLRVIATFSELLARNLPGESAGDCREFMGHIQTGVEQMRSLVAGLLNYSRAIHRGPWDTQPVSLSVPLELAVDALRPRIAATEATITWDPLPQVAVNQSRFVQLFQELIDNALRYSAQAPRVHIAAEQQDGEWVVSVRDHGVGIEAEYHERIFQVFQRLHGRGNTPGHGIGLAVCRAVVQRHGGEIWVESEPGKGATFRFTLPIR